MAGTWEALVSGQADLAIGVGEGGSPPPGVAIESLGEMPFVFVIAPHHPLAATEGTLTEADLLRHRAVAVADSAQRLSPLTVNLLPGQDVFTVSSMAEKIDALERGMGCGHVPEAMVHEALRTKRLLARKTQRPARAAKLAYAWRCTIGSKGRKPPAGLALQWWLQQLASAKTRRALLDWAR
jgi:DNA-binding transcriptional LysR family regulator